MTATAKYAEGFTLIGAGSCRCNLCGGEIGFSYSAISGHKKSRRHKQAEALASKDSDRPK